MHRMHEWLILLGARQQRISRDRYVLDGCDPEFYLIFDTSVDPETPASHGSVDVLVCQLHSDKPCRIIANAKEHGVMRLLFALGISRFSEQTKQVLYAMSNPLRAKKVANGE